MKKRIIFAACAWLLCLGHAMADELTIGNVTVPQGGAADVSVTFAFTTTTDKVGFTFALGLPKGVTLVKDEYGDPVYTKDETSISKMNIVCAGEGNFAGQPSNENATIKGTEGTLLTFQLQADKSLAVGSTHTVSVTKVTFQQKVEGTTTDINLDDFSFTVTVGEPADTRTVLDEASATVPESATGVDIRVKRTIKAGEWSTLCLPFAMTDEQVKAVFGDDVQLGDFTGAEPDIDDSDNVTGITVNFDMVTAIEANHPYVIKVSAPVSEFTLDAVDLNVAEDEAYIEFDNGKSGSRRVVYSGFYGTYHAGTVLDEFTLFLSEDKFWYSAGSTKMKGYRAYFDFLDVLTEAETAAGARITMVFNDDTTTGIIDMLKVGSDGSTFDLLGRKVGGELNKGLYIQQGKKIVVK